MVACVADPAAVESLVFGAQGLLGGVRPGFRYVEASTVSPEMTKRVAEALRAKGADLLEAPMTGSKNGAASGTLLFMTGGRPEVHEELQPVLMAMGTKAIYCGEVGQGATMKLIGNSMISFMLEGLSEGIVVGRKAGLSAEKIIEVFMASGFASPYFQFKGGAMARRDFEQHFSIDLLVKDQTLMLAEAAALKSPMPGLAAIREVCQSARAHGLRAGGHRRRGEGDRAVGRPGLRRSRADRRAARFDVTLWLSRLEPNPMTMKRPLSSSITALFAGLGLLAGAASAQAAADLAVTNAGSSSVKPGDQVTYVITVFNVGDVDALDTMLFDPNPTGLVFLPPLTGDCAGTFPCTLGTLAPGRSRTVTAKFLVPVTYAGPDLIENTASATTSSPESVLDNNTALSLTAVLKVAGFNTLPPCRIADTRNANGPLGGPALAAGQSRTFDVRSTCGLPGNASSISLNITVTGPTSGGDLRLFAGGTPAAARLGHQLRRGPDPGQQRYRSLERLGNLGVLSDQATGSTHFILDVNGYFSVNDETPTAAGSRWWCAPRPRSSSPSTT